MTGNDDWGATYDGVMVVGGRLADGGFLILVSFLAVSWFISGYGFSKVLGIGDEGQML